MLQGIDCSAREKITCSDLRGFVSGRGLELTAAAQTATWLPGQQSNCIGSQPIDTHLATCLSIVPLEANDSVYSIIGCVLFTLPKTHVTALRNST